jgi:hypothetical protein
MVISANLKELTLNVATAAEIVFLTEKGEGLKQRISGTMK